MYAKSAQSTEPLRYSVQANYGAVKGVNYLTPSVSPLLTLPVISELNQKTLLDVRFNLIEHRLEDVQSLSGWLLIAIDCGWVSPNDIDGGDKRLLYLESDKALSRLSNNCVIEDSFQILDVNLAIDGIGREVWSSFALYGIENGFLEEDHIQSVLEGAKGVDGVYNVLNPVLGHLNDIHSNVLIEFVDDRIVFSEDDWMSYEMDDFLQDGSPLDNLWVMRGFKLIDLAFVDLLLPEYFCELFIDGYCYYQEDISQLVSLGLTDDIAAALDYIEDNQGLFEAEWEEDMLIFYLNARLEAEKQLILWSGAGFPADDCHAIALEMNEYANRNKHKTPQDEWLERVSGCFLEAFSSRESWQLYQKQKINELEREGIPSTVVLVRSDYFAEEVIQPLFENHMNGEESFYSIDMRGGGSVENISRYLSNISTGVDLVNEACNKTY